MKSRDVKHLKYKNKESYLSVAKVKTGRGGGIGSQKKSGQTHPKSIIALRITLSMESDPNQKRTLVPREIKLLGDKQVLIIVKNPFYDGDVTLIYRETKNHNKLIEITENPSNIPFTPPEVSYELPKNHSHHKKKHQ